MTVQKLETWIRTELPVWNNEIEKGNNELQVLIYCVQQWGIDLQEYLGFCSTTTCEEARKIIQMIGFLTSSIEKHYQGRANVPGTGIAQVPQVVDILVQLSSIAHHPPRDTQYTYWLWNNNESPLTFTGDRQEVLFNKVVNQTNRLNLASCDALRPISEGNISIDSTKAIAAIEYAAENTREILRDYRSFMNIDENDQKGMTPDFFAKRMRTYLAAYPINNIQWGGPNATNVASQVQIDYLLGTVNSEYANIVYSRFTYHTPEDQEAVKIDMSLPSLTNILLNNLGLTHQDIENLDNDALMKHIAKESSGLRTALVAYKKLFTATCQLTGYHMGLIKEYLEKFAAKLTIEEKAQLAVKPDRGAGGKTHADTEAIMRMRIEHPVASKLVKCIKS